MALKYFTNAFKGNASDSIAINPNHVVSVFETLWTNPDTNELGQVTNIFGVTGTSWQVEEDIVTVVARLNERD
jgi:hypothetical protein